MTPADLPDRLRTALTERFTALGNPYSRMEYSEQAPDGWPASHPVGPDMVAEVLRELLADAPARQVVAPVAEPTTAPPADTDLREQLRREFGEVLRRWGLLDEVNDPAATEEFAVTDLLSVLPASADRAAVLREAAQLADRLASEMRHGEGDWPEEWSSREVRDAVTSVGKKLRRLADEAQQPETEAGKCTCGYINESWIKMRHAADCPAEPAPAPSEGSEDFRVWLGRQHVHGTGTSVHLTTDPLPTPAPSEEPTP